MFVELISTGFITVVRACASQGPALLIPGVCVCVCSSEEGRCRCSLNSRVFIWPHHYFQDLEQSGSWSAKSG